MNRSIISFIILALFISCSTDDEPQSTITSEFYFDGQYDGQELIREEKGSSLVFGDLDTSSGSSSCRISFHIGLGDFFLSEDPISVTISFNNAYNVDTGCDQDKIRDALATMLPNGTYDFRDNDSDFLAKDITVKVFETQETFLSTESGNQPSTASFTITNTEVLQESINGLPLKIEGELNCTVFDDSGDAKTLTGTFVYKVFV